MIEQRLPRRIPALLAAIAAVGILASCAQSPAAPGGGETGGGGSGTETGGGSSQGCADVETEGYDLFLDPELSVDPKQDVYSLQQESDTISFTYSGDLSDDPGFSWDLTYIQENRTVVPVTGAPFFDEDGGVFSVSGPQSPGSNTNGPFHGFLTVTMTTNARFDSQKQTYVADTSEIGRVCVLLAK